MMKATSIRDMHRRIMDYSKLQNGSDIRGTAIKIDVGKEVNLTRESVRRIGAAFAEWLYLRIGTCGPIRVSIGRDPRLSGEDIAGWLTEGLCAMNVSVTDFGLASTPAMFMSTVTPGYMFDGAVMVTASHLPYERNGLKFFTRGGGLEKSDIASILDTAQNADFIFDNVKIISERVDFLSVYAESTADMIRRGVNAEDYMHPLKGLKTIVDAGNGAGGFFVEKVLKPLGADTEGSIFLEPDGLFPNHAPNPEDARAMAAISDAVVKSGADFGIIFDTDVDRAAAVTSDGREINRNRLIALMSAILLRGHEGSAIVTDSITSTGLTEFIRSHGGVHRRFKRGYRNVINEAVRLNNEGVECLMAIETSGHCALKENYFLDDGAYLIAKLLIELATAKREGRRLEELTAGLCEPLEAREFRIPISRTDYAEYGASVLKALDAYCGEHDGFSKEPENFEGVRVNVPRFEGWFLLRMSLHDPLMPLNIESDVPRGVEGIAGELLPFLMRFDGLDISGMTCS